MNVELDLIEDHLFAHASRPYSQPSDHRSPTAGREWHGAGDRGRPTTSQISSNAFGERQIRTAAVSADRGIGHRLTQPSPSPDRSPDQVRHVDCATRGAEDLGDRSLVLGSPACSPWPAFFRRKCPCPTDHCSPYCGTWTGHPAFRPGTRRAGASSTRRYGTHSPAACSSPSAVRGGGRICTFGPR
jgi:hypothetical protein